MVKPNFLIIGTQKGGTESIKRHLSKHPDIFVNQKELHYFSEDNSYKNGNKEYEKKLNAGLKDYINLSPVLVPYSAGRNVAKQFHKSKKNIVERLMSKLFVAGHKGKKHWRTSRQNTGKITTAHKIIKKTFEIIEQRTKENPVNVFVEALVNAAPREEIITIEYGGARYPKAVECAPQRRIDIALRYFCQGAYQKSFNTKKAIEDCLADEICRNPQEISTTAKDSITNILRDLEEIEEDKEIFKPRYEIDKDRLLPPKYRQYVITAVVGIVSAIIGNAIYDFLKG